MACMFTARVAMSAGRASCRNTTSNRLGDNPRTCARGLTSRSYNRLPQTFWFASSALTVKPSPPLTPTSVTVTMTAASALPWAKHGAAALLEQLGCWSGSRPRHPNRPPSSLHAWEGVLLPLAGSYTAHPIIPHPTKDIFHVLERLSYLLFRYLHVS